MLNGWFHGVKIPGDVLLSLLRNHMVLGKGSEVHLEKSLSVQAVLLVLVSEHGHLPAMAVLEWHSNFETCYGTHNMWKQSLSLSNGEVFPEKQCWGSGSEA